MSEDLKKLEWYTDLADDLYENPENKKAREVWSIIDDMVDCKVNIPSDILRMAGKNAKFATPLVSDSIKAIGRFLGNRLPIISVFPMRPSDQERERMEMLENGVYWHFVLMNKRNANSAHAQITSSAAKYGAVAFQTKYLQFEKERKEYDKRTKNEMLRFGDFNWTVHHPATVYPVWSNGVLKSATAMFTRTAWDVIQEYGEDSPAARELKRQMGLKMKDIKPSDYRKTYVSFFDHTGCYCRVVWMTLNGSSDVLVTNGADPIEIVRESHDRGFVNWVIMDNGEPIMESIVKSGTYDHLAQVTAITFSKWIKYASQVNDYLQTNNPNNPNLISNEDDLQVQQVIDSQTNPIRLQPTPPDPSLMVLKNHFESQLARSVGVAPLLSLAEAAGGNTPFSSLNAIQATAVVQLSPVQALIERAEEEGCHQMLRWIYATEMPSTGYRMKTSGSEVGKMAGMPVVVAGDNMKNMEGFKNVVMFNPSDVFISLKLSPASIQDKQAAAALALQRQQVGWSKSSTLEESGVDNAELELSKKYEELLLEAEVQADVQKKIKEVEIWAQGELMKMQAQLQQAMQAQAQAQQQQAQAQQQQAQQQQPPQPMTPENNNLASRNPSSPYGGMDSRFGAPAPSQMGAPNRVQATGRDDQGRPLT